MRKQENIIRQSVNLFSSLTGLIIGTALLLASSAWTTATATVSTIRANGKIAFTSNRDFNMEIYVMNNDGTGQVRLTNNTSVDCFPTWSPDGRRIAFVSENDSGIFAIKLMNADGTNQIPLTPITFGNSPYPWHEKWSLSWSPDGSKIAFEENGEIFTINIDGSNRINLTNHPAADIEPSWSPDGTRIIFASYRVSWVVMHTMNADGSDVQVLPSAGDFWDMSPDWSPTGNKIAFVVHSDLAIPILYTANADGTNRQIFDGNGNGSEHRNKPKWSPDATKIVFHIWEYFSRNSEIYVKNVNGGGLTQLTNTNGSNFHPSWQPLLSPTRTFVDFDGDGRSDISVFRPSDGVWYLGCSQEGFSTTQFGLSTDKITSADYDGDGKTDIAVFRNGAWYWLNSSNGGFNAIQFGLTGDIPQPADFDGDGQVELAVYRGGTWYTLNLTNNQVNAVQFGISTDKPVVGDYDGDGRADYAVYRDGTWYLLRSTQGFTAIQFGLSTDKLVPADYDDDGKTDPAVYRDGTWYVFGSQTGFTTLQFGLASDIPVPADYDGDGRTDAAVYRDGVWYLRQSTAGTLSINFGLANDMPIPSAYFP